MKVKCCHCFDDIDFRRLFLDFLLFTSVKLFPWNCFTFFGFQLHLELEQCFKTMTYATLLESVLEKWKSVANAADFLPFPSRFWKCNDGKRKWQLQIYSCPRVDFKAMWKGSGKIGSNDSSRRVLQQFFFLGDVWKLHKLHNKASQWNIPLH